MSVKVEGGWIPVQAAGIAFYRGDDGEAEVIVPHRADPSNGYIYPLEGLANLHDVLMGRTESRSTDGR